MNENDRHMSPCKRVGYHVGDLFQTTENVYKQYIDNGGDVFIDPRRDQPVPGSLVRLVDDDNTGAPYFRVVLGYNALGTDMAGKDIPLRLGVHGPHLPDVEPLATEENDNE